MLCPVCMTECASNSVCPECGFNEVGRIFTGREEAEKWYNSVVLPYKETYNNPSSLPAINWEEIIKQNPQSKHFFEFSIPVAIKRNAALEKLKEQGETDISQYVADTTLGHVAVISKHDWIIDHFFKMLKDSYLCTTNFKRTASLAIERAGDAAAILSNLDNRDVLFIEMNGKMKKEVVDVLSKALSNFILEVSIGKGKNARKVRIELPRFTTVFIAESINEIPDDIISTLEHIIEYDYDEKELDDLQIREMALFYDVLLTAANIEVIKEYIYCNNCRNIKKLLKFISDYLFVHEEIQQPLSPEEMNNILTHI